MCGPMGGGETGSHDRSTSEDPHMSPRQRAGRFPDLKGLVRTPRTVWRTAIGVGDGAVAPSLTMGHDSHECYAFLVGKGNVRPSWGQENGPIEGNISYLWGGTREELPPGGEANLGTPS